jgi:predicted nucleic acid-binding protein
MATSKKTIYWDACVFIAWLHEERHHGHGVFEGIEFMAREINANRYIMFTSVLTMTEVLDNRLGTRARTKFTNVFKRTNVSMVNQDPPIAERSHRIRNHYDKLGYRLSTPDSIHLATAIIYKADEFYTLDGEGRKRNGDLLPLSGDVAGYPLAILKPDAYQGTMFAGLGATPAEDTKPTKTFRRLVVVPKAKK